MRAILFIVALLLSVVVWLGFAMAMGWRDTNFSLGIPGLMIAALGLIGIVLCAWRTKSWAYGLSIVGLCLITSGLLVAVFIPQMVNHGSGQDAVGLICFGVFFIAATVGVALLVGSAVIAVKNRKPRYLEASK